MRVQPNEGVSLNFEVKVPGAAVALTEHLEVAPVDMDFSYAEAFGETAAPAYETLLLDVMIGEMTLFTRSDEVEAAWKIIDPLLKYWEEHPANPMPTYPAGSWGPPEADRLISLDGARWRDPEGVGRRGNSCSSPPTGPGGGAPRAGPSPGKARAKAPHPGGGAPPSWGAVLHMRAWTGEVARRVREGNPGEPAEGDWPAVGTTSASGWRAALEGLTAAHAEVAAAIGGLREGQLDERVGGARDAPLGTGVTYREMLHGLAQHDAYHSGQIALLKRLQR